jgi:hypothetical protein
VKSVLNDARVEKPITLVEESTRKWPTLRAVRRVGTTDGNAQFHLRFYYSLNATPLNAATPSAFDVATFVSAP